MYLDPSERKMHLCDRADHDKSKASQAVIHTFVGHCASYRCLGPFSPLVKGHTHICIYICLILYVDTIIPVKRNHHPERLSGYRLFHMGNTMGYSNSVCFMIRRFQNRTLPPTSTTIENEYPKLMRAAGSRAIGRGHEN